MAFTGSWKVSSFEEENLNKALDAFGIPQAERDRNMVLKAAVTIAQDGDNFTMNATGGLGKKGNHSFKVGDEINGELFGKKYQGSTSWDGDKVVFKGKSGMVLTRSIEGSNMVYTVSFGGHSGRIVFSK